MAFRSGGPACPRVLVLKGRFCSGGVVPTGAKHYTTRLSYIPTMEHQTAPRRNWIKSLQLLHTLHIQPIYFYSNRISVLYVFEYVNVNHKYTNSSIRCNLPQQWLEEVVHLTVYFVFVSFSSSWFMHSVVLPFYLCIFSLFLLLSLDSSLSLSLSLFHPTRSRQKAIDM